MSPILIEPLSEQAYLLLRQLEALHVLRLLPGVETPAVAPVRPSAASLIGSLSVESATHMTGEITASRSEWEREF